MNRETLTGTPAPTVRSSNTAAAPAASGSPSTQPAIPDSKPAPISTGPIVINTGLEPGQTASVAETRAPRRRASKAPPLWIWIGLAVGALTALILLILILVQ